jgi:8-oxo-dGTP pyrophosphatase MutT (NUDIX family)
MKKAVPFSSTTNMLIFEKGKILLIKRDESLKDFPGWLMLPGGKQEHNETPKEAAIRETEEETGLKAVNTKLRVIATHYHYYKPKTYLVYIFTASKYTGTLIDIEKDKGTPVWVPVKKALNHPKLYPDLKRHIRMITKTKSSEPIFTYHKFNADLKIKEER